MNQSDKESFIKAQAVNVEKLSRLDAQESLSASDKAYRSRIQTQFDIIDAKLNPTK